MTYYLQRSWVRIINQTILSVNASLQTNRINLNEA